MEIGKALRKLRISRGLSQRELAVKAGMTAASVSYIETGAVKSPRLETRLKLSIALGVSRDELLGVSEEKEQVA